MSNVSHSNTIDRQHRASNPQSSVWVHANAGSGKTHVLAQRVIRLLLSGVVPSKILCLTFTKAAAANMSMRIFDTLAAWTALDDASLKKAIAETGAPVETSLADARRLFVRTIETPGGLKVQTIHAFCERLLHLFPFESNTAARFEALDDQMRETFLATARAETLHEARALPQGPLAHALSVIAAETGETGFEDILKSAITKRDAIRSGARHQSSELKASAARQLGLDPDEDRDALLQSILQQAPDVQELAALIDALADGGATDIGLANRLRDTCALSDPEQKALAYLACFFTKSNTPLKTLGTNKMTQAVKDRLRGEQERLLPIPHKLLAIETLERTLALYTVADAILGKYKKLKNISGTLDFDDMIERTRTLLTRSDASWILYKLDAGIDHILVDEAQDTSPAQWDILKRLTEDFFAGEGARNIQRTFFAVGDEKQSIFSFQGAAPKEFGQNRSGFAARIGQAKGEFESVQLNTSFRSAPEILAFVDRVFASDNNRDGLTFDDNTAPVHEAWKSNLPGLVEFWPLAAPQDDSPPGDWRLPLDLPDEHSPAAVMAQRVADKISNLINPDNRQAVHDRDGKPRAVKAGDIMVLVRSRSTFFDCVIRALKERNVPVAGADRLRISDHIAVMDLIAAARAALLPADDLVLATVLKSPLIGLDDDDLIELAPNREGSLWAALCQSQEEHHRTAAQTIARWSEVARTCAPFEFFAHLLSAENGRRKLLSRLGQDANDAIDEFLRLALETGRQGAPALNQFIAQQADSDLEIKRDMEESGNQVRVMTVHAAKGLEAKIVFLPDTCSSPSGGHAPQIIDAQDERQPDLMLWRKSKDTDPAPISAILDNRTQAELQEHRRLLYVALTRAEERLYIGGFHGVRKPNAECWYKMIESTLDKGFAESPSSWDSAENVQQTGVPATLPNPEVGTGSSIATALPDHLLTKAPMEENPLPPVRPSQAAVSADRAEGVEVASVAATHSGTSSGLMGEKAAIGRLVHDLLQYLPELQDTERQPAALRFMSARASFLQSDDRQRIIGQVLEVIADPALKELFGPDASAEAAITGEISLSNGQKIPITGRIDRLAISGDKVLLADFKTGRPREISKTPDIYIRQLALYRAVLQQMFPGKPIKTMIIWTEGPVTSQIPDKLLDRAINEFISAAV